MKRASVVPERWVTTAIRLSCILCFTVAAQANPVTWGGDAEHPADAPGILDAASLENYNGPEGLLYTFVNNDFDIRVITTQLNKNGVMEYQSQATWWFEGGTVSNGSIAYSTIEFRFYAPNTDTPILVSGIHFQLADAENGERFRNLTYTNGSGGDVPISYNSPILSYSSGHPVTHTDGSFDSGSPYLGGTQMGKTIDINLSTTPTSGFKFQLGRTSSNAGSVNMTALGDLLPYVDASGAAPANVLAATSYRGLSAISPSGRLAALIDGTASDNASVTLKFSTPGPGSEFHIENGAVPTEVLSLSGTDGDKVVLQVNYNESGMTPLQEAALYLAWFNPNTMQLVNAVEGNTPFDDEDNQPERHNGAYDPDTDFVLGYYGVDTVNNTVWAVIDHNSDFAVNPVPEPTSALLAICGALPLLARRRRARANA